MSDTHAPPGPPPPAPPPPSPAKAKPGIAALDRRTWPLLRRGMRDYMRPHAKRLVFAVLCMMVAAAAVAAMPQLLKHIVDGAFLGSSMTTVYWICGLVVGVFVLKGFASYGQEVAMNYVGHRITTDIQHDLFERLVRADLAFFHDTATGRLVATFLSDIGKMRTLYSDTLTGLGLDIVTVVLLVGQTFYQDWILASVTFFVFPLAAIPILQIGRKMRKVSANTQAEIAQFTTLLDETFKGARHVKAYGMEAYESGRARALVDRIFRLTFRAVRTKALANPTLEIIAGVAVALVLAYGGWQVVKGGKSPGDYFAFIAALLFAYEPVRRLARLNANMQDSLAAAERVFAALDVKPTIVDRPDAKPLVVSAGAVRIERASFAYRADAPALRDVTIAAPAGQTVALVGPSGAGKSTVLNLIPRFYDLDSGAVTIDGQDVRGVTVASLRAAIGIVSQETALFDDTIRANIAYGRPGASDAEIEAAARAAAAHDFIVALPDGYATEVGGLGAKLSGGQRQRIAIARAVLKNAPILLLDEATSALDTESERQVQAALRALMRGRTTLVIAHRLSTVLDADLIYVLDAGRVVESGTHRALLAAGGLYASLYAAEADDAAAAKA